MNKNKVVMILSFILIFISILNPLLINVYASDIDKINQPYNDKEINIVDNHDKNTLVNNNEIIANNDKESNIIENYNTNRIVDTNEKNQLNNNKNSIDNEHSINPLITSNINEQPLGSIKSLFASPMDRHVVNELRNFDDSFTTNSIITQTDLDKISKIYTDPGYFTWSNDVFKNLHLLRNLKNLTIQGQIDFSDMNLFWNEIATLQNLEILSLVFNHQFYGNRNGKYLINVPRLPKLKSLNLYYMGAAKDSDGMTMGPGYKFNGESLNKNNLPVIEELSLATTPLISYSSIGTLDTLKSLDLFHEGEALDDISFVKNLINLEFLNIAGSAVTDFSPLNNLAKLKKVVATSLKLYYIKDKAIDYYIPTNEAQLPGKIIFPNGATINKTQFNSITPNKAVFDNNDCNLKISNLTPEELTGTYFLDFNTDNNGVLRPYNTKVAIAKFNVENGQLANGTTFPINGVFAHEVNFLQTIPKYNVIFDSNGGSNVDSLSIEVNQKIPEPIKPHKNGCSFAGWYVDPQFTKQWNFVQDVMPKHDLRLYAKWNINLITINHTPSILAQDITLNVGDNFDPLNGISATDYEDGDLLLTTTNIIANNVDTSKPGKYYVTYKVVDTQNASCIKTINVYVNDNILPPTNNNSSHQGTIINPDTGITTPNHNVINNPNKITKENLVQNNKDISTHKTKTIQTSVMSQIIVLLFLSFIILSILVILNRKNR